MARAKKINKQVAISLSPRLQQTFLLVIAISWLFQVGTTVYYLTKSARYTDLGFWWLQIGYSLLPLIFVALSLWYVGSRGSVLNRVFKATFLTLLGYLMFFFVQQLLVVSGLRWFNGYYFSQHADFLHKYGPQLLLYALALVSFSAIVLFMKRWRTSRG